MMMMTTTTNWVIQYRFGWTFKLHIKNLILWESANCMVPFCLHFAFIFGKWKWIVCTKQEKKESPEYEKHTQKPIHTRRPTIRIICFETATFFFFRLFCWSALLWCCWFWIFGPRGIITKHSLSSCCWFSYTLCSCGFRLCVSVECMFSVSCISIHS